MNATTENKVTGADLAEIADKPLERFARELSNFKVIPWENVEEKSLFALRLINTAHVHKDIACIIAEFSDEKISSSQTIKSSILDAVIEKILLLEKPDRDTWVQLMNLIAKNHSDSKEGNEKSYSGSYIEKILLILNKEKPFLDYETLDHLLEKGYQQNVYNVYAEVNLANMEIQKVANLYQVLEKNKPAFYQEDNVLVKQKYGLIVKIGSAFYEKAAQKLIAEKFSRESVASYLGMRTELGRHYQETNRQPLDDAYYSTVFPSSRSWEEKNKLFEELKVYRTSDFLKKEISEALNPMDLRKHTEHQIAHEKRIKQEEKAYFRYLSRVKQKELFELAISSVADHQELENLESTLPEDLSFLKERIVAKAAELLKK